MQNPGFSFANFFQGGGFDASSVDPTPQFTVPTRARYIVGIIDAEAKPNSKETGGMVELTLQIMQGADGNQQFKNVTVKYYLNLFHNDAQTRAIAEKQLSALAHVIGKLRLSHTNDLLYNPATFQGAFIADIGPQEKNPQYAQIYGVYDLQGNAPSKKDNPVIATGQPQQPAPFQQPQSIQQPTQVQPQQQPPWGAQPQQVPIPTNNPMPSINNAQANPPWAPPQPSFQPQQAQPQAPAPTPQANPPWQQPAGNAAPPAQVQPPWAR